jgi:tetratricopeptide (TPR) repeat protein
LTETGKAADALKLLAPVIQSQTQKTGVAYAQLMEANLLAQINSGQVEPAIASMRALEESGSAAGRAQLYFKLGKLLERELSQLEEEKDSARLNAMRQVYHTFLTALAESKSSQTYDSLEWAGESLLTLGAGAEAEKVFDRVLKTLLANESSGRDPRSQAAIDGRILRTKLNLAAARRIQAATEGKLDEAASLTEDLLSQYPHYLEPQVEKGMLLEARAQAGKSDWALAIRQWQDLGQRISGTRPRPLKYFDVWYHAAWCLAQQGEKTKARQILGGIMRLYPGVGSLEMKLKYEQLMGKLK